MTKPNDTTNPPPALCPPDYGAQWDGHEYVVYSRRDVGETLGPLDDLVNALATERKARLEAAQRVRDLEYELGSLGLRLQDLVGKKLYGPELLAAAFEQQKQAEAQVAQLTKERDAWRAATGLAGGTPEEAGNRIDAEDVERSQLKDAVARLTKELREAEADCERHVRTIHLRDRAIEVSDRERDEALRRANELRALADRSAYESGLYARRMSEAQAQRDEARAKVGEVSRDNDRLRSALFAHRADNARLRELLGEARDALEKATAGVWDGHYGKGLSVTYAQSVESLVKGVTDRIDAELTKGGAEKKEGK